MMDITLMLEIAVGVVAAAIVMMVVAAAYREGKRMGAAARTEPFEDVRTALSLGGTEWKVSYEDVDSGDGRQERSARLRFRQLGSRVMGEGETADGEAWSVEGSAQDSRLCFLYLDCQRRVTSLGSVMVEVDASQREMEGIRTSWSDSRGVVSLQPIRLVRVGD